MRAFLALIFSLLAAPAIALSCMPYNAVQAFLDADEAAAPYLIVLGRLTFDDEKRPKVDWSKQDEVRPDNRFAAKLVGRSLTGRGFEMPFHEDITVNVQCTGPWCGGLTRNETYLTFLEMRDDGYFLETGPCGGFAFEDPDPEMLTRIKACFRGERCDPDLPRR
ncbi:hypothetical protein O2N63_01515 [Aliiroseovarius sp. KMU-50]|uniref:Uncharacterized protein n=1 Tax=Aliiroseovarius salicola TaxID=3009082 RepID=A0ABT4VZ06_9RHOB|nr:hypothetical protein [Aliiroseovarius sp. KMU-50]MDA5092763.1 hypothetical protein [Aliiroseovarius sp. KMU-50]